jgi:hypothetical protein
MFWLSKVKILDFIQLAKQTMRGVREKVIMLFWREEGGSQPCVGAKHLPVKLGV